jgi:ribosome-binding protein aMBF1 (putative translation factor)
MDYKQYLKQNKEELNLERYFDIGNLIFEARVYVGMSQEELAKKWALDNLVLLGQKVERLSLVLVF